MTTAKLRSYKGHDTVEIALSMALSFGYRYHALLSTGAVSMSFERWLHTPELVALPYRTCPCLGVVPQSLHRFGIGKGRNKEERC